MSYDVLFGRIVLPTILTDPGQGGGSGGGSGTAGGQPFSEILGGPLDVTGGDPVPTWHMRTRAVLSLPIHSNPPDPDALGDRMRRQMRSLLNNATARQGIFLQYVHDPQINSLIAVGEAELDYGPGAPGFSEYMLNVTEGYRLGTLTSHRLAQQCRVYDKTLATTPHDHLKRIYAVLAGPATPRAYFPKGASDFASPVRQVAATGTVTSLFGAIPYIDGVENGEGISFEIALADLLSTDVVCWDRKGFTAPTYTAAGDMDPQGASGYGWEEVYGSDYEWTAGDVPVLANGVCRVRYTSGAAFTVEGVSGSTYGGGSSVDVGFTALHGARLVEWTPELATVAAEFTSTGVKGLVYITLGRGWSGPLFESYAWDSAGPTAPPAITTALSGQSDSGTGWSALQIGVAAAEFAAPVRSYRTLVAR